MLLMACLLIGFSSTTDARKPDFIREPDRISWPESVIDVDIIGDNRGLLPISGRHYHAICHIEAQRGERYTIRVRNNWHRRIALAISVDGRNIISGERSYNRPNESMYVLQPGQTGHFEGWRSSYQKVQRFYFTSDNDSYAGRMGDWSQLGWIKVAAFREREYLPQPRYLSEDRETMPSASRKRSEQAGTGYGEGHYSPVSSTSFEPENFAAQIVNIKYEWPDIQIRPPKRYYSVPEENNFAPPPPKRD
jgi:hypothetical protein